METTREGRARALNSRWLSGAWALAAALWALAEVTPVVGRPALAAAEAPGSNGPGDDFDHTPERRLLSRHRIESLRMTRGPKGGYGSFFITGHIDARDKDDDPTRDDGVRKIARRFLRQHADLLDVSDPDIDLKEVRLLRTFGPPGDVTISFRSYLDGLPVELSSVAVHLNADGVIYAVQGNLIPLTPELIEAVRARRNKPHVEKADLPLARQIAPRAALLRDVKPPLTLALSH